MSDTLRLCATISQAAKPPPRRRSKSRQCVRPRPRPVNCLARSFPHPNIRSPTYRRSKSPTRRPRPNPKPRRPPNCCARRDRCWSSEIRNRTNRPPSRRERAPSPNYRQSHPQRFAKLRPPNRPRHRPQHRPQTNLTKLRYFPRPVRRCRQRLRARQRAPAPTSPQCENRCCISVPQSLPPDRLRRRPRFANRCRR